ncbi:cytochrome b [Motiliproteus coralliicola]|uniref:Cytochrome b n=1 Tax=Motiliproteus coralliicola TaxID=2283196 RepID=A0A369WQQ4_9GAMM|nr:cytochrome b [Motiliproteus coralliicola]RDE22896.1 cytochrome b [Motiliproteus coralliicola]
MKYSLSMRLLHWSMAAMIIGLLAVGLYMTGIPDDAPDKYDLYPAHKAFGFIVLMLILVRVATRLRSQIPALPDGLASWEQKLSHAMHALLYLSMVAMAVSGYLMSSFYEYSHGIELFGLITVPDITEKSEYWSGVFHLIHEIGGWVMIGALGFHIAGVIKHRWLDAPENDVLGRMV